MAAHAEACYTGYAPDAYVGSREHCIVMRSCARRLAQSGWKSCMGREATSEAGNAAVTDGHRESLSRLDSRGCDVDSDRRDDAKLQAQWRRPCGLLTDIGRPPPCRGKTRTRSNCMIVSHPWRSRSRSEPCLGDAIRGGAHVASRVPMPAAATTVPGGLDRRTRENRAAASHPDPTVRCINRARSICWSSPCDDEAGQRGNAAGKLRGLVQTPVCQWLRDFCRRKRVGSMKPLMRRISAVPGRSTPLEAGG